MRVASVVVLSVSCVIAGVAGCSRRDEARGRYGPETPVAGVTTVLTPPSAWGGGPPTSAPPIAAPSSSAAASCVMPDKTPTRPTSVSPPRNVVPPMADPAKRPRG